METENRINEKSLKMFRNLAVPTLIFAVIATFSLYDNFNGFTMMLFVVSVVYYDIEIAKRFELPIKSGAKWYSTGIILLGVADICTNNKGLVFYNNCMIFILMVSFQIYLFYDQSQWKTSTYISSFGCTVLKSIECIGSFFEDTRNTWTSKKNDRSNNVFYMVVGILLFIPFGIVLLALLMSADAVFNNIVHGIGDQIFSTKMITVPLFFVVMFIGAYCSMRVLAQGDAISEKKDKKKWSAIVSNTVLFLTSILYLIFSLIQIGALFLDKMELPKNQTYSSYAREGFGQLLFVCFINICLVLFVKACFEESLFTKILLSVISCCTYIMLASSAMRLLAYIRVYNLSVLRVQAAWALVMIAIAMAVVIISVFSDKVQLVHTLMTIGVIGFFVLTMIHPDALVAKYNLKYDTTKTDEYCYLSSLSIDAAKYVCDVDNVFIDSYKHDLEQEMEELNFREYNLSWILNKKYIER